MNKLYELKQNMSKTDSLIKDLFKTATLFELRRRSGVVLVLEPQRTCETVAKMVDEEEVVKIHKIEDAKDYINNNSVRLFILDIHCDSYGIELMEWIKEGHTDLPVIISVKNNEQQEKFEVLFPDVEIVVHDAGCQCNEVMECLKSKTPTIYAASFLKKQKGLLK